MIGSQEVSNMPEDDQVLRFFIIGDYGELSNYFGVRGTSIMMENLAKTKPYDYIITAGDNFYSNGITNIYFRLKPWLITNLFKRSIIGNLDIYPTLGNHD